MTGSVSELEDPRAPAAFRRQLRRSGVVIEDVGRGQLRCMTCGAAWCAAIVEGGRYRRGSLLCPRACNALRLRHRKKEAPTP